MRLIKLTQGMFAQVNDEDYEWLNQWKWFAQKSSTTFYARRFKFEEGKRVLVSMHRLILGLKDKKDIGDHVDLDGLNNQRYNLRLATRTGNNSNTRSRRKSTSKYLGVNLFTERRGKNPRYRYKAQINLGGKKKLHLGYFDYTKEGEIQAAIAYNTAAASVHGEFANLNIIE